MPRPEVLVPELSLTSKSRISSAGAPWGRYHISRMCYRRFGGFPPGSATLSRLFVHWRIRAQPPVAAASRASSYSSNRSNHSSTSAFSRYSGSGFNFRYRDRNRWHNHARNWLISAVPSSSLYLKTLYCFWILTDDPDRLQGYAHRRPL